MLAGEASPGGYAGTLYCHFGPPGQDISTSPCNLPICHCHRQHAPAPFSVNPPHVSASTSSRDRGAHASRLLTTRTMALSWRAAAEITRYGDSGKYAGKACGTTFNKFGA